MIIATVVIDTHHRLPDGSEGIHFKHQISWGESDKPTGIELAQLIRDRLLQGARAAAEIEGVRIIEEIYPPEETEEPTKPLEPDLAAALVVAKQEFTGLAQLVQHSPRHIAEIHLATLLWNYLNHTAHPLLGTINNVTTAAEELAEANQWLGTAAAQVLQILRDPDSLSDPATLAQATAILEAMCTPEDEQEDWMNPETPPPAQSNSDSVDVLVEIVDSDFGHVSFAKVHYDHKGKEWAGWRLEGWEPSYQIYRWRYLPTPAQKETDE